MNFGTAFKVFEMNVLRQSGIAVTPQQVGLKSDPLLSLQAKSANNSFSQVLGGITVPSPPTPPADPTDTHAQANYQAELLTYQNNMQLYNQRFMQMMITQFQSMQRTMMSMSHSQANSVNGNNGNGGVSSSASGVGGILDV